MLSKSYWNDKSVRRRSVVSLLGASIIGIFGLTLTLAFPRMFPPPYWLWGGALLIFGFVYVYRYQNEQSEIRMPLWGAAFKKPYDKFLLGLALWTVAVGILFIALILSFFA